MSYSTINNCKWPLQNKINPLPKSVLRDTATRRRTKLRHYRMIQRVRIGAKICAAKRRKTAGILCVLQGFATHLWGKLAARTCVGNCPVMPKIYVLPYFPFAAGLTLLAGRAFGPIKQLNATQCRRAKYDGLSCLALRRFIWLFSIFTGSGQCVPTGSHSGWRRSFPPANPHRSASKVEATASENRFWIGLAGTPPTMV